MERIDIKRSLERLGQSNRVLRTERQDYLRKIQSIDRMLNTNEQLMESLISQEMQIK